MQYDIISKEEIQKWYDTINLVLSNYGPSNSIISQLQKPEEFLTTNTINNVYKKIEEFLKDEYLKTAPELYNFNKNGNSYEYVAQYNIIYSNFQKDINDIVTNLEQIKCRNTYCGHGTNSNGNNAYGTCPNGTCSNRINHCGANWGTPCTLGGNTKNSCNDCNESDCNYGTNSNGKKTNGICEHGSYSETIYDIKNVHS